MNKRKFTKRYPIFIPSTFAINTSTNKLKDGIIYTLYSDKFNSLKVGFAYNNNALDNKLSSEAFILLDRRQGDKKELFLLMNTLKELGFEYSENFFFNYSISLMRHLSTLGWPVGRSLHKQRKIKKELQSA